MKYIKSVCLLLALVSLNACSSASSPLNIGELKTQVSEYKESGSYERDFDAEMKRAEAHILAQASKVKNPAIILDIDETTLSNWPQLKANDYAFFLPGPCENLPKGPCGIQSWQKTEKAQAFPATLELFNSVKAQGVSVFFITGRMESERAATERNLKKEGFRDWAGLVMRPKGTKTKTADLYKAPQRAKIESKGYTIIANIGDQPSDLKGGGAAEKDFLLPNPFYRIP